MMRNLYVLSFALLFLPAIALAGEVTKCKGTNCLIELKGDSASPGDLIYSSSDGKHRGILKITKVKGDKAIAKLLKGKAEPGMTTEPRPANAGMSKHGGSKAGNSRSYIGGVVGLAMDKMSVQVNNFATNVPIGTANLSGMSFSALALFDYQMFPQIWFRGLGGLEGFSVTGAAMCGTGNTQTCNATIYYLAGDFLARYLFSEGDMRPWLGGGVELMFPASKNSTALNPGSIGTTNAIQVAGGVDWFINKTTYIPISLEYGLLPKSNEVDATWIALRVGMAFAY